jgi:hypothetical protein
MGGQIMDITSVGNAEQKTDIFGRPSKPLITVTNPTPIAFTNTPEGDNDSREWIVRETQKHRPLLYAALLSGPF